MQKFILLITISLFSYNLSSQTIQWENTIGGDDIEWNDFTEKTNDGNVIIGGYSYSNISGDKTENSKGQSDFWLVKLNSNTGNLMWQKTIGGNSYDHLTSGFETSDYGYILGGYSSSSISGDKTENSRGADDFWILKLDSNRNIVWQKTFGGSGVDRLTSIISTNDGGYLISGDSDSGISGDKNSANFGLVDIWIIKINSTGNIEWQKNFGGDKYDSESKLLKTSNNTYILSASSSSNISGNKTQNSKGLGDYWILNLDLNGNIIWQKTIGGSNGDHSKSLVETSDGNLLIAGDSFSGISGDKTQNTYGNNDIWLLKLNSVNGTILWQKNIGGNSTDWQPEIKKTFDNNYIILGMSTSNISGQKTEANKGHRDYWLIKIDSNGQVIWDKTIGGDFADEPQSIVEINPDQFICSGWSQSNASGDKSENKSGLQDNWVVKLNNCNNSNSVVSNQSVCINQNLNLTATSGTNYSWTGPNGFTSNLQNPSISIVNATHSGQYTCTITGTGDCDGIQTINVFVGDNTKPIPTTNPLPTINGDCNTIITVPTATDNCAGLINGITTDQLTNLLPGTHTIHWSYNDGNGNIETQNQTVIISTVTLPTLASPQTFCIQQNATLNSIVITGQNIKWYDAPTNGNLLPNTTVLVNGTTYYASQTINGCESNRVPVLVQIQNTPTPSGNTNQSFCSTANATVADIIATGTNVVWYNSVSSTTPLANTTLLTNNTTFYATQTINGCVSANRLAVTISLINTLNATNYSTVICDNLNDNTEISNLNTYNSNLISSTGNIFSYYNSYNDALSQNSAGQITNSTNYNLVLGTNTFYVRIASPNTCFQIVTLTLDLVSKPIIPINDIEPLCEGRNITLNGGNNYDSYTWSTGETSQQITITQPGNYSVIVTENHGTTTCTSTKNFVVVNSNIATIQEIISSD